MKLKKVTNWSLSALQLYEECPRKYKMSRLEGRERTTSAALERGIMIHAKLENYLNGEIKGMPPELKKLEREIKNIKRAKPTVEEEFVFDKNWKQVTGPSAWTSKDAWVRGKSDIRVDNFIVDLKTGRHYDKYREQAELYSLFTFILNPDMQEIEVEFWYSKTGEVKSYTFQRSMMKTAIEAWTYRVGLLFAETIWPAKENQYCNWCAFQEGCPLFGGDRI